MNEVRADRVQGALAYYRVTGLREVGASLETVISDLLSDLRHLCDRAEIDLGRVDRLAHLNYLTEKHRQGQEKRESEQRPAPALTPCTMKGGGR